MENTNYKHINIEKKYWNTWYDWWISYIRELIRKIAAGFKDKVLSLFNRQKKKLKHTKNKKKKKKEIKDGIIKDKIIRNIRVPF